MIRGAQKANKNALKHGYYSQKRSLYGLDTTQLDRRYKIGRVLAEWREALIRDLGGKEAISTQQEALVDLAVKSKLLLDSIDAWLLTQPSLVNARKRSLLPAVRERQQLADGLARYLGQLGLERRTKEVPSLTEYLNTKYGSPETSPGSTSSPSRKRKSEGDSENKEHKDA